MRLQIYYRKLFKNEFDDLRALYNILGYEPFNIIDAGANIGFVTYQFQKKFPKSKIYAFEPNPEIFERLSESYKKEKLISCINKGVGAKADSLTFYQNANSGTSSFLAPTKFHLNNLASKKIQEKTVGVIPLEQFMESESIEKIDILKLDIEGFELEALKGISGLERRVDIIFTEVNLVPTYVGQPLIHEIIQYLNDKKFSIYNIYGLNENNANQGIITNLMFLSNGFRNKLEQSSKGYLFKI